MQPRAVPQQEGGEGGDEGADELREECGAVEVASFLSNHFLISLLSQGGGGHQHLGGDHHGHSHGGGEGGQVNIRAALFHVLTDFLQSIGVKHG